MRYGLEELPRIQIVEMPTGAAVVENVVQVMVVAGVAGTGEKVSGASLPVVSGFVGSPQSVNDVVVTTPANALFFDAVIVIALLRFWVVPIVTVEGTAKLKCRIQSERAMSMALK